MQTEKFSKQETKKLKKILGPYGAIKECCEKTGIHRSTISRILKTGEATDEIAMKLRNYLEGFATRLFIDSGERSKAA